MNLKFTKEQVEKIISAYYKVHEGKDVTVESKVTRGYEGRYEIPCANVKMIVTSKIKILEEEIVEEKELNKSEVTDIFRIILSEQNYEVSSIYYEAGLTTEEYFTHSYPSAYFSGVNVEVEKTVGQKVKKI